MAAITCPEGGGHSARCPLCGKEIVLLVVYEPLADAPCPNCGTLLFFRYAAKPAPSPFVYELMLDTPENRAQAAAVAAELEGAWEDFRRNRVVV
jgi:hypothetical protein